VEYLKVIHYCGLSFENKTQNEGELDKKLKKGKNRRDFF